MAIEGHSLDVEITPTAGHCCNVCFGSKLCPSQKCTGYLCSLCFCESIQSPSLGPTHLAGTHSEMSADHSLQKTPASMNSGILVSNPDPVLSSMVSAPAQMGTKDIVSPSEREGVGNSALYQRITHMFSNGQSGFKTSATCLPPAHPSCTVSTSS